MLSFARTIQDSILNLTFPQRCHCCASEVKESSLGITCAECWTETTLFDGSEPLCPKCGVVSESGGFAFDCGRCREQHYDAARSLGIYEKALSANLLHLKKIPVIPEILLDRLKPSARKLSATTFDLIIPVPLSAQRQTDRGFNQADAIAHVVSRELRVLVDRSSLTRRKHTPMHRFGMDRKAREMSVENAFAVTRPNLIRGRNILLVDDIFTSGATVSNCAKALKKKGAGSVRVLTLARTRLNAQI